MSLEPCAECAQSSGASHQESHHTRIEKLLTTERMTSLLRSEEGRSTGVSLGTKNNMHILHSVWFSNIPHVCPLQTSACLKHSNFLNTDGMGTLDGPTAVHMKPLSTSVINNSDRDVSSSFRATQILRQGPVHPTLWNTSVLWDRLPHVQ